MWYSCNAAYTTSRDVCFLGLEGRVYGSSATAITMATGVNIQVILPSQDWDDRKVCVSAAIVFGTHDWF